MACPNGVWARARECAKIGAASHSFEDTWMTKVRAGLAVMERAAELLREGRLNVTQVSLEVGYSSLSHFSMAFHESHGCCPGLFPPRYTDAKGWREEMIPAAGARGFELCRLEILYSTWAGRSISNFVFPGSLSYRSTPPNCWTKPAATVSPSPVAFCLFLVEKNGW